MIEQNSSIVLDIENGAVQNSVDGVEMKSNESEVAVADAAVLNVGAIEQVAEEKEYSFKNKPVYSFFKRCFDLVASALGIIILSPLLLIIAVIIKCTSKGPVLYVSQRVGKNGKVFKFYKFRTMIDKADEKLDDLLKHNEVEGGVIFKMKDDPRITKFGKFLRKSSLDELPQLFNVFLGNMTIVGPRPCTVREYEKYNDYHKQRLLVKQGITCLWQCSGRSKLSFDKQIELDLEYIQKRGFWYDIWLILRTIPAVFKSDGAE